VRTRNKLVILRENASLARTEGIPLRP
jgi:hypothetical protein